MLERLRTTAGLGDEHDVEIGRVVGAACGRLGKAPSMVVTVTMEDALGVEERPNMPGTIDQWPNWRLALPRPLEDIETDADVCDLARTMNEGRDASRPDGAGHAIGW